MSTSWSRVEPILAEALALPERDRRSFIARACAGDVSLQSEVESLVGFDGSAAAFLEGTALEDAARELGTELAPDARLGTTLGDYRLDAVIGIGGMGEVYRARDLRLDRDVAVKVLAHAGRPEDRALVGAEARAASRLNHPNIVTIHAVGEHQGLGFIAMELVPGSTLRSRLADGPLDIADGVALASQLAAALASAHDAGIVHRDLKPENIVVTPGALLKVLDFGIARGQHAPSAPVLSGTIAYMSPEQAAGEAARPVSDQFAFGVVASEMFSGLHPFARATRDETLAAIRTATPARLESLNRSVPAALGDLVARCLSKNAADRFPSTAALAHAVNDVRRRVESPRVDRRTMLYRSAAAVGAAAVGGGAFWKYGPWTTRPRSLAVLPFRALSQAGDDGYLADGLTSTLVERLSLMPSLAVLPRSLVFNFRGDDTPATDLGRTLGAQLVLSGTIEQAGGRLNVTARLDDVVTGRGLWSKTFTRAEGQVLLVEEQVAAAIIDEAVRTRLSVEERRRVLRRASNDARAFDLYLQAVALCQQETERGYLDARELLREALDRDPAFGHGHVQMATTYAVMATDGLERPIHAWPASSRHVRRALEAEPALADAFACAASHEFSFNWDWDAAEAEWRRAVRFGGADLHPDLLSARALQRWALGRTDEALGLIRQARARDPISPMFAVKEADFLLRNGELARAGAAYGAILSRQPNDVRAQFGLAEVHRRAGHLHEAVDLRRRAHEASGENAVTAAPPLADDLEELRRLDIDSARLRLALLQARADEGGYVSPLDVAREHARRGDSDRALALLEPAMAERAPGLAYLNVDTVWDFVRDTSAFAAVRERVGLPKPRGRT